MANVISDTYVVGYLLQGTMPGRGHIVWHENEAGGYATKVGGVYLELNRTQSSTGSRLYVALSDAPDRVYIEEPQSIGSFSLKYENEDEMRLAELIRKLHSTVQKQCISRRMQAWERKDEIKEKIYRRLVFGESCEGRRCQV